MEASALVIKVRYGDSIRRFNASVTDDKLDLSMCKLIEKIYILFNFATDTELTLTYIDEDGETIALVDDDDLRDAVEQALNPLRIMVRMNEENNSSPFICSAGSSTPLSSPRVQQQFQNINSGVSEILKTIPDPLRETLAKLSTDLVSKLSSSAPDITPGTAEIVEYFSKLGLSCLSQISELQARVQPTARNDVPERRATVTETKDSDLSKVDPTPLKAQSQGGSKKQLPRNNENSPKLKSMETMVDPTPMKIQLQGGSKEQLPRNNENSSKLKSVATMVDPTPLKTKSQGGSIKKLPQNIENSSKLKAVATMQFHEAKVESSSKGSMEASSSKAPGMDTVAKSIEGVNKNMCDSEPIVPKPGVVPDSVGKKETANVTCEDYANEEKVNKDSGPHLGLNPAFTGAHDCMKGGPLDGWTKHKFSCDFGNSPHSHIVPNPGGFINFPASFFIPFHAYECQASGIPVENISAAQTQPASQAVSIGRNRSQNDVNGQMRIDNCHNRIDLPAIHPQHWPSNLDSCFIHDVTMIDGTIITPLTPCTKIWRMRNNGTVVWPGKTRLVWIGGDKLSNEFSVELQVPAAGLAVNQELDVAVDFVSPQLPGHYVSHWRMAAPSGHEFGQCVSVHIQVRARETQHGVQGLNLNLAPVNNVSVVPKVNNAVMDPLVKDSRLVDVFEPFTPLPNIEQDMKFPISDSSMVGSGATNSVPTAPTSNLDFVIDQSDVAPQMYPPPYVHYPSPPPPVIFPKTSPLLYTLQAPPVYYPLQPPPPSLLYPRPPHVFYPPPPPPPPPVTLPPRLASLYTSPSPPSFCYWPPPAVDTLENTEELREMEELENELLWELEEMGFKQVDLNREILRFHDYDMQQTLDDLRECTGWDLVHDELQEMK